MTRNETDIEIRKIRKKLRQVENLELLERDLTEEECLKVSKKAKLRVRLQQLLSEKQEAGEPVRESLGSVTEGSFESSVTYSEYSFTESLPQDSSQVSSTSESLYQNLPIVEDAAETSDVIIIDNDDVAESSNHDVTNDDITQRSQKRTVSPGVKEDDHDSDVKRSKLLATGEPQAPSSQVSGKPSKAQKKKASPCGLSASYFHVNTCVGHNDLVVAVATDGDRLLSGSRDTTLKFWDCGSGRELHSFGGHTGSVSAVCLLTQQQSQVFCRECEFDLELPLDDQERIGLSGSTDCTLKVWALVSGQLIRSSYTFNPITCVQYIAGEHLAIVATGGGKLEMWDVYTGQNVHSQLAHQNLISCLQVSDTQVFSASVDGEIQVYNYSGSALTCVYRSEELKLRGGGAVLCRPVRSLTHHAHNIYYGDDGSSVKVLDWCQGEVSKLKNHVTDFGSTDALGIQGNTIFCSGYDLDVGVGYINCRDVQTGAYMCTLCDEVSGRIVCLSCQQNQEGRLILVTGGLELKIWTQLPNKSKASGNTFRPLIIPEYRAEASHSDVESSGSSAESEDEEPVQQSVLRRHRGDSETEKQPSGWTSWCQIL